MEKAHHNKFTLNKEKKLLTIILNHLWFFDTKWKNKNTFSKIKERKRKNKEEKRGGKIKEEREKLSREKRVIRVINYCKWVSFTLKKIKSIS